MSIVDSDPLAAIKTRYLNFLGLSKVFQKLRLKQAIYDDSLKGMVFTYYFRNSNVLEILFLKSETHFRINEFPWFPFIGEQGVIEKLIEKLEAIYACTKPEFSMFMMELLLVLYNLKPQQLGNVLYKVRLHFCIGECFNSLKSMGQIAKARSILEETDYWKKSLAE